MFKVYFTILIIHEKAYETNTKMRSTVHSRYSAILFRVKENCGNKSRNQGDL